MSSKKHLALAIVFLMFLSVGLQGDFIPFYVNYNFPYGARGLGMGNAFVAVADDLTAMALNPAGLAFMNYPRFDASFRSGRMNYDFLDQIEEPGIYSNQLRANLSDINFVGLSVPALFWDMKWHFALSYHNYIPSNASGEWRYTSKSGGELPVSFTDAIDFTGKGGADVLGFSASIFLLKGFSFGITFQQFINNGERSYEYSQSGGISVVEVNEKLSGHNLVFGLLARPMEDLSFAITYQTRMSGTFDSQTTYRANGSVETGDNNESYINIPARLALGIAARLVPAVNLSYEFSRIMWSRSTIGHIPFPTGEDFSFQQSDIINHRLGIEGRIPLGKVDVFLRGGLSWERQLFVSADDGNVTLKGVSFGVGARLSYNLGVDLGYMHQRGDWLQSDLIVPSIIGHGVLKNNILALSFSYTFIPKLRKKPSFFNPGK